MVRRGSDNLVVDVVVTSPRVTWSMPNGEWGVRGLDLASLPPRAYAGLARLKDIEDALETVQAVQPGRDGANE